jgi:arylsulfatase A-like enzyme
MMRAFALALLLTGPSRASSVEPLNVVVIDVCSARADRFGSYGGPAGLTPGLDAFAKESTVFENAWAQSSWCLPNYATLLTGHRPEVNGVYSNLPFRGLPDWEETVAERMRQAGYRTGGFTAGVYTLPAWGLSRGFDTYVNHFSTSAELPGRFSDMTPEIEDWIVAGSSRPFFLYTTVDDLHAPYQSDESDPGFDGPGLDSSTMNVGFFRAYNGEPIPADSPLAAKAAAFRRDPKALESLNRRYERALRSTDRSISRFLDDLKKRGLWDRTVVVVTADHGELLGEHGLLGHTEGLYEPILRVPMYVRHPRYPRSAGTKVSALVERIDLAPTLLESGGASVDGLELQGRSLLPLLGDPSIPWKRFAYASSKRNVAVTSDWTIDERAVRDERWKLIWALPKEHWELYDLKEDPLETRDLAAERPDVVARLAFELEAQTERARTHAAGRPSGRVDPPTIRLETSEHY